MAQAGARLCQQPLRAAGGHGALRWRRCRPHGRLRAATAGAGEQRASRHATGGVRRRRCESFGARRSSDVRRVRGRHTSSPHSPTEGRGRLQGINDAASRRGHHCRGLRALEDARAGLAGLGQAVPVGGGRRPDPRGNRRRPGERGRGEGEREALGSDGTSARAATRAQRCQSAGATGARGGARRCQRRRRGGESRGSPQRPPRLAQDRRRVHAGSQGPALARGCPSSSYAKPNMGRPHCHSGAHERCSRGGGGHSVRARRGGARGRSRDGGRGAPQLHARGAASWPGAVPSAGLRRRPLPAVQGLPPASQAYPGLGCQSLAWRCNTGA